MASAHAFQYRDEKNALKKDCRSKAAEFCIRNPDVSQMFMIAFVQRHGVSEIPKSVVDTTFERLHLKSNDFLCEGNPRAAKFLIDISAPLSVKNWADIETFFYLSMDEYYKGDLLRCIAKNTTWIPLHQS